MDLGDSPEATTESSADQTTVSERLFPDAESPATPTDARDDEYNDVNDVLLPANSQTSPTISVVMPTLNEEEGIAVCIERIAAAFRRLDTTGEIIVSDSSTDQTPEIARDLGAIVVEPNRRGYGYAYRYAFQYVRGDYVVIGDADTTYDFEELPRLYDLVARDGADMAIGSRLNGEIKDGAMPPLHRYVGNPLLTAFLNTFYDAGVSDAHSGFRVIRRESLESLQLSSDGMEFASEMIMKAGEEDMTIEERPITYHPRKGDAKLESVRDGWRHVRFMLVNAPDFVFAVPAVVLGVTGIAAMALGAVQGSAASDELRSVAVIVGGLLSVAGHQLALFAVFSAVAGNSIRTPRYPLTRWITERFRLQHGVALGVYLVLVGGVLGGRSVAGVLGESVSIPDLVPVTVPWFVVFVLGLHTLFSSFFVSTLGDFAAQEGSPDG